MSDHDSCCHPNPIPEGRGKNHSHDHGDSCGTSARNDWVYLLSIGVIALTYLAHLLNIKFPYSAMDLFTHQIYHLMNDMWWGLLISVVGVGFLNKIPREMVMRYFSRGPRLLGLAKATVAGTLFDLCNHGVLILGMKIYERGASLGQTMAFLISSPWNSFSLTIILYALVGGQLTFLFMILSLVIALISGWIFDELVDRDILPGRKTSVLISNEPLPPIHFAFTWNYFIDLLRQGLKDSKMIFKWIFIGVILSAVISALVSPEIFIEYFGNSLKGAFATLAAATGLEVCSEGFVPLAADLVRIAKAPGNAFIFLMAGVATDLTEILVIRQTMKSWKVALFLPLITVPQIMLFGILINMGIL